MKKQRQKYTSDFKLKVVLESIQRDTTIEKVRKEYRVGHSQIHRWKQTFKERAAEIYETSHRNQSEVDNNTIEEYKITIGELTMENQLLKKAL